MTLLSTNFNGYLFLYQSALDLETVLSAANSFETWEPRFSQCDKELIQSVAVLAKT